MIVFPASTYNPIVLNHADRPVIERVEAKLPESAPQEETTEYIENQEVEEIIDRYARLYKYPYEKAYWLAVEESRLNPKAVNGEGSSAKGLYMFVDGTWKSLCDGDVFNPHDSTRCAIRLLSEGQKHHWLADERIPERLLKRGIVL